MLALPGGPTFGTNGDINPAPSTYPSGEPTHETYNNRATSSANLPFANVFTSALPAYPDNSDIRTSPGGAFVRTQGQAINMRFPLRDRTPDLFIGSILT